MSNRCWNIYDWLYVHSALVWSSCRLANFDQDTYSHKIFLLLQHFRILCGKSATFSKTTDEIGIDFSSYGTSCPR